MKVVANNNCAGGIFGIAPGTVYKTLTVNGAVRVPRNLAPQTVECAKSERVETDSDAFVSAVVARFYLLVPGAVDIQAKVQISHAHE